MINRDSAWRKVCNVCLLVLQDFPSASANIPFEYLFDLIPPIQPRAFSIASSLKVRGYVSGKLNILTIFLLPFLILNSAAKTLIKTLSFVCTCEKAGASYQHERKQQTQTKTLMFESRLLVPERTNSGNIFKNYKLPIRYKYVPSFMKTLNNIFSGTSCVILHSAEY